MKKRWIAAMTAFGILTTSYFAASGVFASGGIVGGQSGSGYMAEKAAAQQTVAFPGAEGGGMYSRGARGALDEGRKIEVYHVTNLNNSGEGSFRDAVSKGNRIVVFDVAGNIQLDSNVSINKSNLTILGQTAPGDGICFSDNNIKVGGKNVILRYLRFRVGDQDKNGNDTRAQDGLEIVDDAENIIVDHCSVSWGTDENLSAYAVKDVTIQWSIIAEALNQSVHDKGEHSYAAIWGGVNLSIHHNLIATHKSRNPKIGTSETVAMTEGYQDNQTLVDLRNNVIYNWGDKAGYGSENGAKTYLINNTYKPGPATPATKRTRIFELSVGSKYKENYIGSVYASGNQIDIDPADGEYAAAQLVNENNWQDALHTGVYVDKNYTNVVDKSEMVITHPDQAYQDYQQGYPITTQSAAESYTAVLDGAGATLPKRDAVDSRVVGNVRERTAPTGSKGSEGLLDSPVDGMNSDPEHAALYDEKGYPKYEYSPSEVKADADGDGIPDTWEDQMGLDQSNPLDSTMTGPGGYTWLELYVEEAITHPKGDGEVTLAVPAAGEEDYLTTSDTPETLTAAAAGDGVESVKFYFNDQFIAEGTENGGVYTAAGQSIPSGSGYLTAQAVYTDGRTVTSATRRLHVVSAKTQGTQVGEWQTAAGVDTVWHDSRTGMYELYDGLLKQQVPDGDFDLVCRIGELPAMSNASETRLMVYEGDENGLPYEDGTQLSVGLRYGANYQREVFFRGATENTLPGDEYQWLKISRVGGICTFYAAESLLQWDKIGEAGVSETAGLYAAAAEDGPGVAKLETLRMISAEDQTAPAITIDNVAENQRLGFSEELRVTVTPDEKAPVSEVAVMLGDAVVASKTGLSIGNMEQIDIPLSFSAVASGVLKAVCYDQNLGMAAAERNVVVSGDMTPWRIADVGAPEGGRQTFAAVTPDYTYKINAPDGQIGGTADRFGYLYQQFRGDQRIYFRSRMQGAKQLGLVLKKDLNADGVTYFFGGDTSGGALNYQLKGRPESGGEMSVTYALEHAGPTMYFVAEKSGDWLTVYQTENTSGENATVYHTKTQLAKINVAALGNTYYLGFGAVYGEGGNPPDIGWPVMEGISEDDQALTVWDFDNGLDWGWQMQEKNVLTPSWTDEELNGVSGGKLLIAPGEEYPGYRYIFHEYFMQDRLMPAMQTRVLMQGDNPELNLYFQTGDAAKAYQVTFSDDGNIYAGTEIAGQWDNTQGWYTVRLTTAMDEEILEQTCRLEILDKSGSRIAETPIEYSQAFRTQNNTEKIKTPVTHAVYFEPAKGTGERYYIDDVSVWGTQPGVIVEQSAKLLNFEQYEIGSATTAGTDANGFTMTAGMAISDSKKTVGDESFTRRIQMDKGSKTQNAISFPVSGDVTIQVYAAQGGKSNPRNLILDNGKTQLKEVIGEIGMHTIDYTGGAGTITLYSDSKIYIYGVKVITTKVVWLRDAITAFTPQTGQVSAVLKNSASAVLAIAAYDQNGFMLECQVSDLLTPDGEGFISAELKPLNEGVKFKAFLWEGLDSIRPLAAEKVSG